MMRGASIAPQSECSECSLAETTLAPSEQLERTELRDLNAARTSFRSSAVRAFAAAGASAVIVAIEFEANEIDVGRGKRRGDGGGRKSELLFRSCRSAAGETTAAALVKED